MDATTRVLLRGYGVGDRTAFDALYSRIAPRLYVWCSLRIPRPLWPRLDPEDLVQEIWLRAVSALARYDENRAGFRTWLYGIAARTLAEQLRRLSVRRREGLVDPEGEMELGQVPAMGTSIVRGIARREQLQRFVSLVADLSPIDRHLLLRRGIEGAQHKDVAEALGIRPEAAEMRWRRLLQRLRVNWSEQGLGELT